MPVRYREQIQVEKSICVRYVCHETKIKNKLCCSSLHLLDIFNQLFRVDMHNQILPVSATCYSSTAVYPDAERVIWMRNGNWFISSVPPPLPPIQGVPKRLPLQTQISALIQFQSIQFHMIRSFSPSHVCKTARFTHLSFKSDNEFQRTAISCLN